MCGTRLLLRLVSVLALIAPPPALAGPGPGDAPRAPHLRPGAHPGFSHLYWQMAPRTQRQIGGSCHVHGAVALFEAACRRATGALVDVSEGYLFYQSLREKLLSPQVTEVRQGAGGFITTEDGGWPERTLRRILARQVLTEAEFPTAVFMQALRREVAAERQWLRSGAAGTRDPRESVRRLIAWMDRQALALLPRASGRTPEGAVAAATASPELAACAARGFAPRAEPFTPERAIAALSAGQPFVCTGFYAFGSRWVSGEYPGWEWESYDDPLVYHVSTVIGHRLDPRYDGGVEFLVRDSNDRKPTWGWDISGCEAMITLE